MKKDKRIELGKALQKIVKSTGQNEAVALEGGNLVNHNIIPEILSPNFMAGTLYERCKIFNVGDNTSGIKLPIADEATRNTSGIKGGVLAYVVGEGDAKTPSDAKFSILDLGFNKIAVVIPLTDEIKQDSELLVQYVSDAAKEAIQWMVDRNIIYGNALNGIVASAATGDSAISSPITAAELKDIYDMYYGGKEGVWVMGQDLWVEVGDLWNSIATQAPGIPLTFEGGDAYLWGHKVIVSDVVTDRQIMIGDFSQYVIVQKEITEAINESLKFVEDESYLRFVLRINGDVTWVSGLTTTDGSKVYPFVVNTAAEGSSSSSSSSSSVDSSSSSSQSNSSNSSSSQSTSSSSSSSVDSSSSESSEDTASTTSSSSSLEGCCATYAGTAFTTTALNGDWAYDGDYPPVPPAATGYPSYVNQTGTYYLWYESVTGYWAMSADKGDPQVSWVSTTDTQVSCPDGDVWVNESGIITCTEMSSSSSSESTVGQ